MKDDAMKDDRLQEQLKSAEHKSVGQDMPTRWHCDTDCRASNRLCRGEGGKDPSAPDLCPYYEDMLF